MLIGAMRSRRINFWKFLIATFCDSFLAANEAIWEYASWRIDGNESAY